MPQRTHAEPTPEVIRALIKEMYSSQNDHGNKRKLVVAMRSPCFKHSMLVEQPAPDCYPLLHGAALTGNLDLLDTLAKEELLLPSEPGEVEPNLMNVSFEGKTPLLCAVLARCLHTVRWLLHMGSDPNHEDGLLPLRYAVEHVTSLDIIKELVEAGADPDGCTPGVCSARSYVLSQLSPEDEQAEYWHEVLACMGP